MKTTIISLFLVGVMACLVLAQKAGLEKREKVTDSTDGTKQKITTEYYTNNNLIRREFVEKRKGSGTALAGYTKLYQDGLLVCVETWGPGAVRERTFYRDGKQLFVEIATAGNGIPQWIIMFRDDGKAYAVLKCSGPQRIDLLGTNAVADFDEGIKQSQGVVEAITNIVQQHRAVEK
jgi:antitoxin component YwqK of YwqJK toxin-antitoxin module